MPVQTEIQGFFKGMIKSSGYIKYFRHQCTTLLQICRYFGAFAVMTEDENHHSFHKFVAIVNQALQAVANAADNDQKKEVLQGQLNQVVKDLETYCKTLKETRTLSFDDYDPIALMVDAQIKDKERGIKMATLEKLKKVATVKNDVVFFIHDGGNTVNQKYPKLVAIDGEEVVVLKGAGGFLYHARHVVNQLGMITGAGIFQLDPATSTKARVNAKLEEYDGVQILVNARAFICAEQERLSPRGWLVEIHPASETPPENVVEAAKIRRKIIYELPPDSTPSHPSAVNNNAAVRVKAMVDKIEKEEKEAKNRNKELEKKKGFLSKVFGR
ncbi:unnamed protein product [Rhizoctonia solani]|uniref:Uncharacterized protein n=1 Tax=Rhizoctonia solani TaxID=456999 RepID=A0A8H2WPG3_9AGAM|nr:unnamed protein product [Rhizoctonia solani]